MLALTSDDRVGNHHQVGAPLRPTNWMIYGSS